jgi:MFS family permease
MTVSDSKLLLSEPACTFVCYVAGSLSFALVVDAYLPVGGFSLLGFAVACYAVSAKAVLASRCPSPPSEIEYGRETGVRNYGRWEARNFVGSMLTILLAVLLAFPVFRAELTLSGRTASSAFSALYYLGVVPTAFWTATRLTAQYLPAYRPHLYPDDYTRPLDGRQGE